MKSIGRSGGPLLKKPEMHPRNRHRKKPPRGMYLSQQDLLALATGPPGQGDAILKQLDAELVQLKRQVQNNKQIVSMHKQKTSSGIDVLRISEVRLVVAIFNQNVGSLTNLLFTVSESHQCSMD